MHAAYMSDAKGHGRWKPLGSDAALAEVNAPILMHTHTHTPHLLNIAQARNPLEALLEVAPVSDR